jgi:hypothetical protein
MREQRHRREQQNSCVIDSWGEVIHQLLVDDHHRLPHARAQDRHVLKQYPQFQSVDK